MSPALRPVSASDFDRGVSRLDQVSSGTHGWQVRLQRKGVRYGRFFSDSAWGGRESALEMARRYRDRLLGAIERKRDPEAPSPRSHTGPTVRSRSGVVGVCRIRQVSGAGVTYHFWQASWTDAEGTRRSVRFSVLEHGEERAFFLACRARREALG